jgi:galactokinase
MNVPMATSLKDIYPDDAVDTQAVRWERLLVAFQKEYGQQADFVSRSPGRVNLIGEVGLRVTISELKLIP